MKPVGGKGPNAGMTGMYGTNAPYDYKAAMARHTLPPVPQGHKRHPDDHLPVVVPDSLVGTMAERNTKGHKSMDKTMAGFMRRSASTVPPLSLTKTKSHRHSKRSSSKH